MTASPEAIADVLADMDLIIEQKHDHSEFSVRSLKEHLISFRARIEAALSQGEPVAWRSRCLGDTRWLLTEHEPTVPGIEKHPLTPMHAQLAAVPVDSEHVLQLLLVGGFVDPAKVEQAREIIANCPRRPAHPTPVVQLGFYLASFKRNDRGGAMMWWGPDNAGYTPDIEKAGIYTEITPGYHDSDYTVPVPVSFLDGCRIRRTLDPGDSKNRAFWSAADLRAAIATPPPTTDGCEPAGTRGNYPIR